MKAANSGLQVNRRGKSDYFNRINSRPLSEYQPQMLEDPVSSMMLSRPSTCDAGISESQILAARTGKIQLTALTQNHYPGITTPNDALPGVTSIGFWNGTGPQDWGIDAQRNTGVKFHFVETGNIAFMADERRFNLGAGDFTMTRPWQLHQLGDPCVGPGRVHWLTIDVGVRNPNDQWRWPAWVTLTPADLAELTDKLRSNKSPACKSTPEIARLFQQLAVCVAQWNNPHSVSRMIANLNQLFVNLLDMPFAQKRGEKPVRPTRHGVETFLKKLEENPEYCGEIQSLKQMAEGCGMGITSFAKHTRELTNVGPMEFLKQCRLNHAAKQLRERPGISITDVCFSNGFNSSQYFATCFRKQFKMSPSEFISRLH